MSDNTVQGTLQQDAEQALRALASMEAGVRRMIERLLQSEQALRGGGAAMETYGASVAQASAAMQVLPVQLAAMAAGLIAGQEPIALLSEQAVKLAEAFGGIAPAAAAVGEAVATMVNPFTAAAATAVVLTVAYQQGKQEADAYARAIALSGNAAGLTVSQMQDAASAVSQTVGTQHEAARVIALLGESGQVAAEDLQRFTETALRMERDVGVAVADTVKAYVELGEKPVEASRRLNERHNYLTAAVYDQIKALQEQGRALEAAALAQGAYERAMAGVADTMHDRLGYLERAWRGLGSTAKGVWDQILGIGRPASISEQIAGVQAQIEQRQQRNQSIGIQDGKATRDLQDQLALLQEQQRRERRAAESRAENARTEREAVEASDRASEEKKRKASSSPHGPSPVAVARTERGCCVGKTADNCAVAGRNMAAGSNTAAPGLTMSADTAGGSAGKERNEELEKARRAYAALIDEAGRTAKVIEQQASELEASNALWGKGKVEIEEYRLSLIKAKITELESGSDSSYEPVYVDKLREQAAAQERKINQTRVAEHNVLQKQADDMLRSAEASVAAAEQEASLASLTAVERAKIVAQRQIEAKYAEKLAEVERSSDPDKAKVRETLEKAKRKETEAAVAKVVRDDWAKTADQIQQSLTDALFKGLESGKDFGRHLRDALKNMFNTLVLRPVISAIMKPVSGALAGILGESSGSSSGGGGDFSNYGGLIGAGLQAYGGYTAGASAASLAYANGVGMMGGDALGALIAGNGGWAGVGSAFGGIMSSIATVMPYVAAIVALWSIVSSLDDSGTLHQGSTVQYSADKGFERSVEGHAFGVNLGMMYSAETDKAVSSVAKGVVDLLDGFGKAFGRNGKYEIATGFADDSSKDGAWGTLRISRDGKNLVNWEDNRQSKWAAREFADGPEGYKQYLAAVVKDTRQVLLDMDLPSWADQILNDLGAEVNMEGLQAAVAQIGKIESVFQTMSSTLVGFAGISDEAFAALMKVAGGVEALGSSAATYYQKFYDSGEQREAARKQIEKQLSAAGIQLPDIDASDARKQYRRLVEAQDLNTEAGRKAYAVLLQLAGAFDAVAVSSEEVARKQQAISDKRWDLEQRLLVAEGKNREALDMRRKQEYDALWKLDPELAKLVNRIWELEDAASAAAEAEAKRKQDREDAYGRLQNAATLESERLNAQLESIDARRKAIDTQRELAQESLSLVNGVFELVRSNARELYGQVGTTATMQAARGWAFVEQSLATARSTGYLPDQALLQEAIGAARSGLEPGNYATQFELDRDRLGLAGTLSQLEAISGGQKSVAEQQLAALKGQSEALDAQTDAINRQLKAQQEMLDYWRRQIDIANGTFDATLSVAAAIDKLRSLLGKGEGDGSASPAPASGSGSGGAVWGGTSEGHASDGGAAAAQARYRRLTYLGTAGIGYEPVIDQALIARLDKLSPLYHSFDGTGDLVGLLKAIKGAGGTLDDLSILSGYWVSDWVKAAASVGFPAFDQGTNYVPHDTPAIVHKGERIIPAADNRALMASIDRSEQSGASALLAEMQALREDSRQQAGETARLNARVAKVLERWDGDGMPQQRQEEIA
ncbi:tail length tape measure protein [Paracidovorax avenae]|uniref:phage tail length tape measure family protein n=1 Tax=Paracidovorax avenae TaxID=80867 RepID=UPI000D201BAB|nr:phage tail length tape measure family protein [Paracidovorax avenae]AVS66395.1 tail length tape measure protein [Paracidovorax avenae]